MFSTKAQAWGFDLAIASAIFVTVLAIFYVLSLNATNGNDRRASLETEANVVGDAFFSEGNPEYWNVSNVIVIGILSDEKINTTKLKSAFQFSQADYQQTRSLFRATNNYYIKFSKPIRAEGIEITEIGLPPTNAKNVVRVSRATVSNDTIISAEVIIWN